MSSLNRVRLTSHVLQQEEELCVPTTLLRVGEASGGYADSDDVEGTQAWPQRLPDAARKQLPDAAGCSACAKKSAVAVPFVETLQEFSRGDHMLVSPSAASDFL